MENQHKHIRGYRDLSQAEIDLMNEIKAHGERTRELIEKVHETTMGAHRAKEAIADSLRWTAVARTTLQTGMMQLTRAVAQPASF